MKENSSETPNMQKFLIFDHSSSSYGPKRVAQNRLWSKLVASSINRYCFVDSVLGLVWKSTEPAFRWCIDCFSSVSLKDFRGIWKWIEFQLDIVQNMLKHVQACVSTPGHVWPCCGVFRHATTCFLWKSKQTGVRGCPPSSKNSSCASVVAISVTD